MSRWAKIAHFWRCLVTCFVPLTRASGSNASFCLSIGLKITLLFANAHIFWVSWFCSLFIECHNECSRLHHQCQTTWSQLWRQTCRSLGLEKSRRWRCVVFFSNKWTPRKSKTLEPCPLRVVIPRADVSIGPHFPSRLGAWIMSYPLQDSPSHEKESSVRRKFFHFLSTQQKRWTLVMGIYVPKARPKKKNTLLYFLQGGHISSNDLIFFSSFYVPAIGFQERKRNLRMTRAENSPMDPVVDELPTENEVVEKLKNSLSAHPGDIVDVPAMQTTWLSSVKPQHILDMRLLIIGS